jgi:hypothetical protein
VVGPGQALRVPRALGPARRPRVLRRMGRGSCPRAASRRVLASTSTSPARAPQPVLLAVHPQPEAPWSLDVRSTSSPRSRIWPPSAPSGRRKCRGSAASEGRCGDLTRRWGGCTFDPCPAIRLRDVRSVSGHSPRRLPDRRCAKSPRLRPPRALGLKGPDHAEPATSRPAACPRSAHCRRLLFASRARSSNRARTGIRRDRVDHCRTIRVYA